MAEKFCDTINQNIEPHTGKLVSNYFKELFNNSTDRKDSSKFLNIQPPVKKDESNLSFNSHSYSNTESHEIEDVYMDPTSVWDRGKITNVSISSTLDDIRCLRRLESSATNLESFLETIPKRENSFFCQNTHDMTSICPPKSNHDDTLSDVDLDKFDENLLEQPETAEQMKDTIVDAEETASLSNYHNVRDVLLNIRERLESYLKVNQHTVAGEENVNKSNLERNISDLKRELERFVNVINEKKENELRKFSENISKQTKIVQMKKAFSRKEKLNTNIYETLASNHQNYAIADNKSLPDSLRPLNRVHSKGGFTMQNCYDNDYIFETYSDFSSVEYYTMLINEDKSEKLLNDGPPQLRYHEREKISLIFRDPEHVIKQWQNYQLNTTPNKSRKEKSLKLKWNRGHKLKPHDVWGFTLDYHQNRVLQLKLAKERRLRLIFRLFFYFLSLIFFVLIVFLAQSLFSIKKREIAD